MNSTSHDVVFEPGEDKNKFQTGSRGIMYYQVLCRACPQKNVQMLTEKKINGMSKKDESAVSWIY